MLDDQHGDSTAHEGSTGVWEEAQAFSAFLAAQAFRRDQIDFARDEWQLLASGDVNPLIVRQRHLQGNHVPGSPQVRKLKE